MIGEVQFFNNVKGWGIIKSEAGESVFVHHKEICDKRFFPSGKPEKFRTLKVGQRVKFNVIQPDVAGRYPSAEKLEIVEV